MFTGIIECLGIIKELKKSPQVGRLSISADIGDLNIGDSIAVNGLCLTIVEIEKNIFSMDVSPESFNRSNLKLLKIGDKVNLEKAITSNGRFGGHLVSGHIDGTGIVKKIKKEYNSLCISFSVPKNLLPYIVEKGSIAIDGISLTINAVWDSGFNVMVIPHTRNVTNLKYCGIGDVVNIEVDIIAKYVEGFLKKDIDKNKGSRIDLEFLSKHGFIN